MTTVAQHRLIRAGRGSRLPDLVEAWQARELLAQLVRRDLIARYRPTLLGAAWAILQPAAATVVFSLFLGGLVGVPSDGFPYPAFVLLGLLPWGVFGGGLSRAAASLVANAPLVGKASFPRVLLPASAVASSLVDFAFSLPVLALVLLACGVELTSGLLLALVPLLLAGLLAFGMGLLLVALTVRYRDVLHALPALLQLAMFATPVVYPASLVPASHRWLLLLNPMVAVVEGFRCAVLGRAIEAGPLLAAAVTAMAFLVLGLAAFRAAERRAADTL